MKKTLKKVNFFKNQFFVIILCVTTLLLKHNENQIIENNHQTIDNCDTLICYVNKKHNPSGAKLAMNYAKRKDLEIINLYDEKDDPTYCITEEDYYYNF